MQKIIVGKWIDGKRIKHNWLSSIDLRKLRIIPKWIKRQIKGHCLISRRFAIKTKRKRRNRFETRTNEFRKRRN